jgi:hypothetical protein
MGVKLGLSLSAGAQSLAVWEHGVEVDNWTYEKGRKRTDKIT